MAQKTFVYQTFDFFFLFLWIVLFSFEVPDSYPFLFSLGWHQCSSVAQSCLTVTPAFPVHHQLAELAQTHIHWVGDAIQPSHPVIPFSSCPQSLPASGSFQMSQIFVSGAQIIGVSASTSVLPMNTHQDWSPLEWTGWISLQSKGLSRVFCNTTVQKCQFFAARLSL